MIFRGCCCCFHASYLPHLLAASSSSSSSWPSDYCKICFLKTCQKCCSFRACRTRCLFDFISITNSQPPPLLLFLPTRKLFPSSLCGNSFKKERQKEPKEEKSIKSNFTALMTYFFSLTLIFFPYLSFFLFDISFWIFPWHRQVNGQGN